MYRPASHSDVPTADSRSVRLRRRVLWSALALILASSTAATGAGLEQVIDLTDQGTQLNLMYSDAFWRQATTDGSLTVVDINTDGLSLYRVYRLDPSAGTSVKLANIDPSTVTSMLTGVLPILGLAGEAYFVIGESDITAQQDLYRLEAAALAHVMDLTAAGIELPLDGMAKVWTGASLDGVLRVLHQVEMESDLFRLVEIDPSEETASAVGEVQTSVEFPYMTATFGLQGQVYIAIDEPLQELMGPSTEHVYQISGNSLVEVADIGEWGLDLHLSSMNRVWPSVGQDGLIRVVTRGGSFSLYSTLEIDPATGVTRLLTTASPSSVTGMGGGMSTQPILGLDGATYLIIEDNTGEPTQQGLYESSYETNLIQVVDITSQGVTLQDPSLGNFPTGVSTADTITATLRHPSAMDLRRVHRFDPLLGFANPPVTVDLADTGGSPYASTSTIGPNGEVYFIVTDGDPTTPQQGAFRLDGGTLTGVVDLTAEGIELNFDSAEGLQVGTAADGTIQVLSPHESIAYVSNLYELDPGDGSASLLATLDIASISVNPVYLTSIAFAPSGDLYLVLTEQDIETQQGLYRRDGSALEEVADLTAQGITLYDGGGTTRVPSGATSDGRVLVIDTDFDDFSARRVHAINTATGDAGLYALLDVSVISGSSAGSPTVVPAFAPGGDIYFITLDGSGGMDEQQRIHQLYYTPEPTQALLYACSLVTLALLRRRAR